MQFHNRISEITDMQKVILLEIIKFCISGNSKILEFLVILNTSIYNANIYEVSSNSFKKFSIGSYICYVTSMIT